MHTPSQFIHNADIKRQMAAQSCHLSLKNMRNDWRLFVWGEFLPSGIGQMDLALLLQKLCGRAAVILLEYPGEIEGIVVTAHQGDLADGVSAGPDSGQQPFCILHAQTGHILQRRHSQLLLEYLPKIVIVERHGTDKAIQLKVGIRIILKDLITDLLNRIRKLRIAAKCDHIACDQLAQGRQNQFLLIIIRKMLIGLTQHTTRYSDRPGQS